MSSTEIANSDWPEKINSFEGNPKKLQKCSIVPEEITYVLTPLSLVKYSILLVHDNHEKIKHSSQST
jgi:hypothetical protein